MSRVTGHLDLSNFICPRDAKIASWTPAMIDLMLSDDDYQSPFAVPPVSSQIGSRHKKFY